MTTAVDLTELLPTEEHVLEIISPAGKPTGWKITLAPNSHPKAVQWGETESRRAIERAKVIREAQFNGQRYEAEEKTPEQERRDAVQWVIARIITWTPVKIGEKTYEFSDKNAEELLIKPELGFVWSQLTKALSHEALFTKRSAAN